MISELQYRLFLAVAVTRKRTSQSACVCKCTRCVNVCDLVCWPSNCGHIHLYYSHFSDFYVSRCPTPGGYLSGSLLNHNSASKLQDTWEQMLFDYCCQQFCNVIKAERCALPESGFSVSQATSKMWFFFLCDFTKSQVVENVASQSFQLRIGVLKVCARVQTSWNSFSSSVLFTVLNLL